MLKILRNRKFWIGVSILYVIALFLFVIVKIFSPMGSLHFTKELILENREKGYWNLNVVPFNSIKSYFDFKHGINYINILANTVPFILLSLSFSLAKRQSTKPLIILLLCLFFIVFFEVFQLVSCLGSFDIDDIIMNFLSCYIGIIIYRAIEKVIRKHR